MAFRDPRRFGGLTAYGSNSELERAWSRLGADGLSVTSADLARGLGSSRRPIKAALLDQAVVAGIGNIYADESLFAASIHPLVPAGRLAIAQVDRLAAEIRRILTHAAGAGGSTLRDYRDAFGQPGSAVQFHAVYGRSGEPCPRCDTPLEGLRLQGRATVFCPRCQDLSTTRAR
jgi:formamidopyrimidine-DNA glycosylase